MPASISVSTGLDLSRLPAPDIVDTLDYQGELAGLIAVYQEKWPEFTALLKSEPVIKLLELFAYRITLLAAEFNDRAKGNMIAYALDGDLDNLAALFGVTRRIIAPADPLTGTAAVKETDDDLRRRTLLAPDGYSVAGPVSAYIYHALSASGEVLDATATSPSPGEVIVAILARTGDGTAPAPLLALVNSVVNADTVRPLTDHVTVQSAVIQPFTVAATLYLYAGPDADLIRTQAVASLQAMLVDARRLGRDIPRSALIAALHVSGVHRVALAEPVVDIILPPTAAAYCTDISLATAAAGE